jgi:spore germination protein GerM
MNRKRLFCIGILLISLMALAGCTKAPVEPPSEVMDYQVKLYYVNEEAVVSGDDSQGVLMPAEEMTIASTPDEIQLAVVEALKTVPAKEHYGTMVAENLKINQVYTKDGTAFVDLSSENLNGSSTQETLLISQIVRSLRESFPDVAQVQFLVDGAVVESLMGHMAADQPFTE